MDPEEKDSIQKVKALRTYQGDVDEILSKGKESTSTIFIAEQKRKDKTLPNIRGPVSSTFRNKFFIIVGGTLFILGIITIGTVYFVKSNDQAITIKETKALISFSTEKDVSIANTTRDLLLNTITKEKQSFKSAVNSILYINTTSGNGDSAPVIDVLRLLAPKMPGSLSRSFDKKYMIGVYSFNTNEIFLILSVNDYAESYSGMLKWEKDMPGDLGRLFPMQINNGLGNLTFSDEAFQNKDLRIIKDNDGKTHLLYSFIDRNTLVITTNEDILKSVIGKYLINQTVK